MNVSDLNWQTWLDQGDKYMKAASPKTGKSKFNNDILYNLVSMSLESYIMAILDFHQSLPDNHTYTDLMTALETVVDVDSGLKERILKYENIQSICSIEKYHREPPTDDELIDLKAAIEAVGELAYQQCCKN